MRVIDRDAWVELGERLQRSDPARFERIIASLESLASSSDEVNAAREDLRDFLDPASGRARA